MSEENKGKDKGPIQKVGAVTGMGITWALVILVIVFAGIGMASAWLLGDTDAKKVSKVDSSVTTALSANGSIQYVNTESNEIVEQTEVVSDLSSVLKEYMKGCTDEEVNKNIEYLMGAEAVTTMPYISEEEKEENENGETEENLDKDGLELTGQIKFYRYTEGSQSTEENKVDVELLEEDRVKYVSPDRFEEMLKAYEQGDDEEGELFKYFTIEDGSVIVAYGSREVRRVTTGGEGGVADPSLTVDIVNENSTETYSGDYVNGFGMVKYTVTKKIIDYRSLVEQYVMPANLLYCILMQTGDIEFTKAIADLAYENEIAIGIYDNNSESIETVDYKYKKLIKMNSLISINLEDIETKEEDGMPNVDSTTIKRKVREKGLFIPIGHQAKIHEELQLKHRVYRYYGRDNNLYGEFSEPTDDVFYVENLNSNNQITNLVSNENANNFLVKYYKQVNAKSMPTVGVILADTWVAKWTASYLKEDQDPINSNSSDTLEDTILATYEFESGNTSMLDEFSPEYRTEIEGRLNDKYQRMKDEAIEIIVENTDFSVEFREYTVSDVWNDTLPGGRDYIKRNLKTWVMSCTNCRKAVSDWYKQSLGIDQGRVMFDQEILPNDVNGWRNVFNAVDNRTLGSSHVRTCINNNHLRSYVTGINRDNEDNAEAEAEKRKERFIEALKEQITLQSQTLYGQKENVQISFSSTSVRNSSTHKRDEIKEPEEAGKKFSKIFNDEKYYYSREAITKRTGWLWTYMQKNDDTAKLENVIRYLLNIATGTEDYGTFSNDYIKELFTMFEPKEEMKPATIGGRELMMDFICAFENESMMLYLNGKSGYTSYVAQYITEDKTMYKVASDGYGHPTVGFGIDLFNGAYINDYGESIYFADELIKYHGYTEEQLRDMSGATQIPVEIIDELKEKRVQQDYDKVIAETEHLNLTQYQIYALVSRAFNYNISGFVEAYTSYYNFERDDKYGESWSEQYFEHPLYTQFMSKPIKSKGEVAPGLVTRRKSEWKLFLTGYMDNIDRWVSDNSIIECADRIHKYMEQNLYTYSLDGDSLPRTFEESKTGKQITCCATYVSWVLQEAGYLTRDQHTNSSKGIKNTLTDMGWQQISSIEQAEPGDVLYYAYGHTEIYAGNGKVYNAGSNNAIRDPSPKDKKTINSVSVILRAP